MRGRAAELERLTAAVSRLEAMAGAALRRRGGGVDGGMGAADDEREGEFVRAQGSLEAMFKKLQADARRQSMTPARDSRVDGGGDGGAAPAALHFKVNNTYYSKKD